MMKPDLQLLQSLCKLMAVSGDEGAVRSYVMKQIRPMCDTVRVDTLGNIIARKTTKAEGKFKILLDAHMDEVGFMIVDHDGDGFYNFEKVGGIDDRILPSTSLVIGKKKLPGVISSKPIHLDDASARGKTLSFDSLRIDTGGVTTIEPGTMATFAPNFRTTEYSIFSKAIDDRIGVATLIQLAKMDIENVDLWFSFSVQEEIGLRGAKVVSRSVQPDMAIVVDATPANDQPTFDDSENTLYNTRLGFGPAIYTSDMGTVYDRRLIDHFSGVADARRIQYQYRQPGGGGTNAGAIHTSYYGIPTISVSVPHRSTHSPTSMSRICDWDHTLNLIRAGIEELPADLLTKPRG